jgi:CPA2 family monovalent cation:H+ antiporter-2
MSHTALELIELGAVFFGLGLLGRLAGRIGLSPIPLYLIGGLCFGSGGLVPLGDIGDFTSLAGEVGVVLLLLLLGLEYSAAELITGCAAPGRPACSTSCSTPRPGSPWR